jgi:hypothetical protein
MLLKSKGEIQPPPKLKGPAQSVSREIQSWPGIIAATHWDFYDRDEVDGADFYVGEKELGHIHLDGELHLCLTVGLQKRLTEAGLAEPLRWADDCVQAPIASRKDARTALWLFRLGYDRLRGTPIPELRERIRDGVR